MHPISYSLLDEGLNKFVRDFIVEMLMQAHENEYIVMDKI
jgi:hypothetical protein